MQSIDFYIDAAITELRKSSPEISERQLSMRLGLAPTTVSQYRTKRAWPSDETMLALAEIGGFDPLAALMDLNAWRAKSAATKALYQRARDALTAAIVLLALNFGGAATSATAGTEREQIRLSITDLYIMR